MYADQSRLDEKKRLKRAANRRSACTSRARKKAYVEEMTAANARLKRRARVLAMLPDMVLALDASGTITYASPSCERTLRYEAGTLVGSTLGELSAPVSHSRAGALLEAAWNPDTDTQGRTDLGSFETRSALSSRASTNPSMRERSGARGRAGAGHMMAPSASGAAAPPPPSASSDDSSCLADAASSSSDGPAGDAARARSTPSPELGAGESDERVGSGSDDGTGSAGSHVEEVSSTGSSAESFPSTSSGAAASSSSSSASAGAAAGKASTFTTQNLAAHDDADAATAAAFAMDCNADGLGISAADLARPSCLCFVRRDLTTVWATVTCSVTQVAAAAPSAVFVDDDDQAAGSSASSAEGSEAAQKTVAELVVCMRPLGDGPPAAVGDGPTFLRPAAPACRPVPMFEEPRPTSPADGAAAVAPPPAPGAAEAAIAGLLGLGTTSSLYG